MNVNLTPELETLVRGKVESGLFRSASEVVRHALRIMVRDEEREQQHQEYLRRALAEGIAQADRGELIDGEEAFAELERRAKARRAGQGESA